MKSICIQFSVHFLILYENFKSNVSVIINFFFSAWLRFYKTDRKKYLKYIKRKVFLSFVKEKLNFIFRNIIMIFYTRGR